jgi:hypothetical protein
MRKILFSICGFIICQSAFAQKWQVQIGMHSGLFHYEDNGVLYLHQVNAGGGFAYTNNIAGDKAGFSFDVAATGVRQTRWGLIFGIETGYESLQAKQKIQRTFDPYTNSYADVNGNTGFRVNYWNNFGFIGYRIKKLQLKIGYEYALKLGQGKDEGKVTMLSNQSTISINRDVRGSDKKFDLRLRYEANFFLTKRWMLSAGFSQGRINLFDGMIGANAQAFARYLRFGLTYSII